MIKPIIPEEVFELNKDINPTFDGEVIIVNNIFKNYNKILEYINNVTIEPWKLTSNSRNFKDYFDCRHYFNNGIMINPEMSRERVGTLVQLLCHYFNLDPSKITASPELIFNYFKHKKLGIDKDLQHHPHYETYYNSIIYLDPHNNGGTALYESEKFENNEEIDLMYDVSKLKIKKLINATPNSLAIFPGDIVHGGWIKNHDLYYYNWRINLVNFFLSEGVEKNK